MSFHLMKLVKIYTISRARYLSATSLAAAAGADSPYDDVCTPIARELSDFLKQPIIILDKGKAEDPEDPRRESAFIPLNMWQELLRRVGVTVERTHIEDMNRILARQDKREVIKSCLIGLMSEGGVSKSTIVSKLRAIPIYDLDASLEELIEDRAIIHFTQSLGSRGSPAHLYALTREEVPAEGHIVRKKTIEEEFFPGNFEPD